MLLLAVILTGKFFSRIYNEIYSQNLSLVGWYRSCPGLRALPSLKDTEAQLEYQMKLLGPNDASYSPCIGLLASPYTSGSSESDMLVYWVVPPPESCPMEYGKPLKMIYTMVTDPCLSQNVLSLVDTMISYYKTHPRVVMFKEQVLRSRAFLVVPLREKRVWRLQICYDSPHLIIYFA